MTIKTYNLKFKIILLLMLFFGIFCFAKNSLAATYYVCDTGTTCGTGWVTGNDSNAGTSKSAPAKTISGGVGKMSPSDTLIIGNGTYSGDINKINYYLNYSHIPSGTSGAYTTVMAETDGGVTIDGTTGSTGYQAIALNGNEPIDSTGFSPDTSNATQQYTLLRGIVVKGTPLVVSAAKYVKVINCGVVDAWNGNNASMSVGFSEYVLFEGCYAWGSGRTKMGVFHSHHTVVRNCLIRHDYVDADGDPFYGYGIYASTNVEVQNSISIDGDDPTKFTNTDEDAGSFACPTTSSTTYTGPINFTNCIALNNAFKFGSSDNNAYAADAHWTNSVGWDIHMTNSSFNVDPFLRTFGKATVNQCTFGSVTKGQYGDSIGNMYFNGYGGQTPHTVSNSILSNFNSGDGLFYNYTSTYNNIYDSGTPNVSGSTVTNTISTNPSTTGLLYLPRIEAGSALMTAGQSGARVGADLTYQYGKSGTLWGETGYNLLQDGTNGQATVKLWPFPNEDIIKTKMAAYSNHSVTGARGFCTGTSLDGSSQTLTKYIWEYLGNQIPDDIYGTSSDTTPPAAPSGLAVN
jgi:hypothetical protein